MASLTLGLDVGCTSIGWALLDEEGGNILAVGVRVFPEGVDRDQQGGEKSKSQSRREARGMRRQIARRARRRRQLRDALRKVGLLPDDSEGTKAVMGMNPYHLRRKALTDKLELHGLGRALFHLGQRRGYLSNRKTDKPKSSDQKGMLAEIEGLAGALKETGSTLGKYLADLSERPEYGRTVDCGRIRNRHTRRDMYEAEFEAIWEAQRKHYAQLLTDELKYGHRGKQSFPKVPDRLPKGTDLLAEYGVYGLIFFHRRMRPPPRSVVGRCELERREKRCPRAARIAQRFRLLQEVNNLRVLDYAKREERRLTDNERSTLIAYLSDAKERTFEQLRKKLDLPETARFNLERGERKKLQGHETDSALAGKNGIGKRWAQLPDQTKDAIVDILIHEEREDVALQRLTGGECGLAPDEAERASRVHLREGYVSFSRVAIEKLLPHLERGLLLMADDATNSALHAAGYLRPDEREVNQRRFLPGAPNLTNPIVRQAVVEVRKVINSILRECVYRSGHTLGTIRVELAREAKKSFDQRKELRFEQAERRDDREAAVKAIEDFDPGVKPSRATVNRYLLWNEQDEFCVYCGQKISMRQLFSGDTDLDHILPRWRSLDDSMANKVVCHRTCNHDKGDRTPREWLEESDSQRYETVLQVAAKLTYGKQRKFQQKDIQLDDFVARQLTDTAYISRCVSRYLQSLGAQVACTRGDMTSDLCHRWGLYTILDPTEGKKNREDHRQHAVDAIAVALTDTKRLYALANARGKDMPPPWQGFRDDAERAVLGIHVSHRARRGLCGELHEDTFYGVTQKRAAASPSEPTSLRPWAMDWVEDSETFVRRKAVTDVENRKHIKKVRDRAIREILKQHLRDRGIDPEMPGDFPGDVFKGKNTPCMPSGRAIKHVRMLERSSTMRRVSERRRFQYVEPGSNHHVEICEILDANGTPILDRDGKTKRDGVFVTMFDAATRAQRGIPLVQRDHGPRKRFMMSLSINEMLMLQLEDGASSLHRVQKLSEGSIILRPHTYAGKLSDRDKPPLIQRRTPNTLRGQKVTVDVLGRIRFAKD